MQQIIASDLWELDNLIGCVYTEGNDWTQLYVVFLDSYRGCKQNLQESEFPADYGH